MPTTIFVGNHGPRLSLGPGPLPAPVSPPPSDQALREAWDSFRERYVQSMLMHRDKKERMLAQYGWNSMQANEANEELVSFHTRIRADWHSRLRERGLDPTMGQDILDMKEKELLVQLIGEPAFRFRQGDGLGEIMISNKSIGRCKMLNSDRAIQISKKP
ncbi:hypothetical protein DENSPDRAFT_882190 [Dentipellis sp. KUC8613]|nr:hypothetical protein DENSPDRAFT_882190 [Dentipellis sp. KUC8613]